MWVLLVLSSCAFPIFALLLKMLQQNAACGDSNGLPPLHVTDRSSSLWCLRCLAGTPVVGQAWLWLYLYWGFSAPSKMHNSLRWLNCNVDFLHSCYLNIFNIFYQFGGFLTLCSHVPWLCRCYTDLLTVFHLLDFTSLSSNFVCFLITGFSVLQTPWT